MTEFARGAAIRRAGIPYEVGLTATEAALVMVELFKKEQPKALDGDFMRFTLRVWDAHTKAVQVNRTSEPEGKS